MNARFRVRSLRARKTAFGRRLGERVVAGAVGLDKTFEARRKRALLRLPALEPTPSKCGLLIDKGLSQRNLGELTGMAGESINKLLSAPRD